MQGMSYQPNKVVVCKDGFEMSVQANEFAYCTPRINDAEKYTAVEGGFPTRCEPLLMQWIDGYRDNGVDPVETGYAYVPSHVVALICAKQGGVVSGQLPVGVPRIEAKDESR